MDGDWGWWMWAGWLWMALVWTLAGAAIVVVVRSLQGPRETGRGSALEVLRRRYAAGEIDDEEFRRRRDELSQ